MRSLIHGDSGVDDLLVNACVQNLAYDAQCEGSRARWMFAMLDGLDMGSYREAVLDALAREPSDDGSWNADQLCGFARLLAERGDGEARTALYAFFFRSDNPVDSVGVEEILNLDGLEGLRAVVERLGQSLLEGRIEYVDAYPLHLAHKFFEGDEIMALLRAEAAVNPAVHAYLDTVSIEGLLDRSPSAPRPLPRPPVPSLDELEALLEQARIPLHLFRRFGRHGSSSDLAQAFDRVIAARTPEHLMAWLSVFDDHPLPLVPPRLIDLLQQDDPVTLESGLVDVIVRVLSHTTDARLREQALAWLDAPPTPDHVPRAIALLRASYQSGDGRSIPDNLPDVRSTGANIHQDSATSHLLHDIGAEVLKLMEAHKDDDLIACLLWLYEFGPCTICRAEAVERLLGWQALPDEVAEECRFDSNEDIRELFASKDASCDRAAGPSRR